MVKRVKVKSNAQSINSYFELLSHGNAKKLGNEVLDLSNITKGVRTIKREFLYRMSKVRRQNFLQHQ